MTIVLGADPGCRSTGLCVINNARYVTSTTLTATADNVFPVEADYLYQVIDATLALIREHNATLLAIESIARPRWHMNGKQRPLDPKTMIALGQVVGALQSLRIDGVDSVMVPPGRRGSSGLGMYPPQLVSDAERRKLGWEQRIGGGRLKHERSAWDCALVGAVLHKAARK